MKPNIISLNKFQSRQIVSEETPFGIPLSNVFVAKKYGYLNELNLFLAHFHAIPNFIDEINIDCKKAMKWFNVIYKHEIKDIYFNKSFCNDYKTEELTETIYTLSDDLMVYFDSRNSKVRFLFRRTEMKKIEELIHGIKKFKKRNPPRKPEISLLISTLSGIETRSLQISKPKLNIEDNYNDDFKEVHRVIIKRLSTKNDKGLVLLHGKPGTGKTSYIRYLIYSIRKNVIFLPPNMAGAITNPDLISILMDNPNSIFVIEDAENIILDRESDVSSSISALLNISDGLLSDCLNVQIICSFNTDISKIDNALMRKGRLIARYEFKELTIQKAVNLSNKLGFKTNIDSPMSLTAIYNQDQNDFHQPKMKTVIGFNAQNKVI